MSKRFACLLLSVGLASCAGSCDSKGDRKASVGEWKRPDKCKGFEDCNAKCEAGDGLACATVGSLLNDGEYVARDRAKAEATWRRGCDLGAAASCSRLATLVPVKGGSADEAKELRRRAFELGKSACEQQRDIHSCLFLVWDYERGWDNDTKEGQDVERGKRLREEVQAALEAECDAGIAEGCSDAGWLVKRSPEGEPARYAEARPYYERACKLDKSTCWSYGDLLHELKDPGARSVIVEACDADEDGSSCYLPDVPGDVELATKRDAKRRATCEKGHRGACLDLDRVAPPGWAEVRSQAQREHDAEVARGLLRRECEADMGDACYQLANRLQLDTQGKLVSGPLLLESLLLEEKACKLGETLACSSPAREPIIRDIDAFYPGSFHSCLRKRDGGVGCFGVPSDGRVGLPSDYKGLWQLNPIPLPGPVSDVVLTSQGACALAQSGLVSCWGKNPVTDRPGSHVPYVVPELRGAKRLTVSDDENELCAAFEGKTTCFGGLHEKRVEYEGVDQVIPFWEADLVRKGDKLIWTQKGLADGHPLAVSEKLGVVSATTRGICSRSPNGSVACAEVQLDRKPKDGAIKLVPVPGVSAIDISMSGKHACALEQSGSVRCWKLPNTDVKKLEGLDDAIAIRNACAVTKRGMAFCWGGRYDVEWGTPEVMRVGTSNNGTR